MDMKLQSFPRVLIFLFLYEIPIYQGGEKRGFFKSPYFSSKLAAAETFETLSSSAVAAAFCSIYMYRVIIARRSMEGDKVVT